MFLELKNAIFQTFLFLINTYIILGLQDGVRIILEDTDFVDG